MGKFDADMLAEARSLVLRHGWNSTCYQILNPGFSLWFSRDRDAVVGYVDRRRVRVVGGAPVCTGERLAEVSAEFEQDAAGLGKRVCYFGAETRLESIIGGDRRYSVVQLGAQPVWDPASWPVMISRHASVRAQLNRARNKGVAVQEWPAAEVRQSSALRRCLEEWLSTRGLPPLHFLVETDTLALPIDRRWFVAVRNDTVIGFAMTSPVPCRNGWLIEQFVRGVSAVNGTTELMLDAAMEAMVSSGSTYATLGLAPLSTHVEPWGYSSPIWLSPLLAWMRAHGRRFYDFRGLEAFKEKFWPDRWDPVYAIVNEPRVRFSTLYAIAAAFADGSPVALMGRALSHALLDEARRALLAVRRRRRSL